MTLVLVAGMSTAAVVLAVVMATVAGPEGTDQHLATGGQADFRTSTTYSPFADPNSPLDGPGSLSAPVIPALPGQETPGPGPGAGPGGEPGPATATIDAGGTTVSGATVSGYHSGSIWPETNTELATTQAGVDDGHQPWWDDPSMVASAYLLSRGVETAEDDPPRSLGEPGALRYVAGGVGGWVNLGRLLDGSIYFVEGSRSDRIVQLRVTRQGDRLAVDVLAAAPGQVVVRTKRPGGPWGDSASRTVVAGKPVALTVDGPAASDLIVQVRHEGDDGKVGLSEQFLGAALTGFEYEGLHDGSTLGPAWLGMVDLGATLAEAERMAGIAMDRGVAGDCATLQPVDRPAGVRFLALPGRDRVDVIVVAAPGVRTTAGVGVGSTADEVQEAYPAAEADVSEGVGRLVYRPADPVLGGHEMVFDIADGRVTSIGVAGEGLLTAEEFCA